MVFSSLLFISYFLPLTLIFYYAFPKIRNYTLTVASILFYAFGEPIYIVLLLGSSTLDYLVSKGLDKTSDKKKRKLLLLTSVLMNISLLGFFKYADFIVEIINTITGLSISPLNLPLPIGISFYTFQTLSYTIDVYRGNTKANKKFTDFLMYISMFPQLIAGPIVRYVDVEKQLVNRKVDLKGIEQGAIRFIMGLSKKVLLADQLLFMHQSLLINQSVAGNWIAMIAYGLHIYFDFSGYSDMAIGLGKMMGFDFLENFNYPYIAKSVSEFWRRWHISLGNWFKDYVYFPLGGSRVKLPRLILNLAIVWMVTGLWHGANTNFVLWGMYFGFFIIMEKLFLGKLLDKIPSFFRHVYLLIIVLFGWVLFNFVDMSQGLQVFKTMLFIGGEELINLETVFYLRDNIVLFLFGIVAALPFTFKLFDRLPYTVKSVIYAVLLIFTIFAIADSTFSPFIYFRF